MVDADSLARLALFADLGAGARDDRAPVTRSVRAHTKVLRQGLSGATSSSSSTARPASGSTARPGLAAQAGEFFGEVSLLLGEPVQADVVAESEELRCAILPGLELRPLLLSTRRRPSACSRWARDDFVARTGGRARAQALPTRGVRRRCRREQSRRAPDGLLPQALWPAPRGCVRRRRPRGMFRKWPMFQNLISWTELDAPADHGSVEYERFDQNSLLAEEPNLRGLVAASMGREGSVLPSRAQMHDGLRTFAEDAGVDVRYDCRWEATRRDDGGFVLTTTDGEYRCRAAVFALGVTEPWRAAIPGIEAVPHYAEISDPGVYRDRSARDRQEELRLRDRERAAAVGTAAVSRLAAARCGPTCSPTRPCAPVIWMPRGRRRRRRRVLPRRKDRVGRAIGARLPLPAGRHDLSGRPGIGGRRCGRRYRLSDTVRRPTGAWCQHRLAGQDTRAELPCGRRACRDLSPATRARAPELRKFGFASASTSVKAFR